MTEHIIPHHLFVVEHVRNVTMTRYGMMNWRLIYNGVMGRRSLLPLYGGGGEVSFVRMV